MNRGVLQSSPVVQPQQQMMMVVGGGNRNPSWWWNVNKPPSPVHDDHQLIMPTTPTTVANWHAGELFNNYNHQDQLLTAESSSWTQLLLSDEELDKSRGSDHHHQQHQLDQNNNWDQEQASNQVNYGVHGGVININNWSQMLLLSAKSSTHHVTTTTTNSINNNMLNFSSNKPDRSSEDQCNSSTTIATMGGVAKKARVQPSSTQATFKVRKEKLGDRITALHQIVSPFGKTDTASVLLEAIGYIRFLQGQIEALSLPYLGTSESVGNINNQHSGESELCDEDEIIGVKKDLKSRGLCLVPVSCTIMQVESGADYWSQAIGGAAGNFQQNI